MAAGASGARSGASGGAALQPASSIETKSAAWDQPIVARIFNLSRPGLSVFVQRSTLLQPIGTDLQDEAAHHAGGEAADGITICHATTDRRLQVERRMGRMPYLAHDGSPLHYLQRGRGEAVLMIHGLGSTGADWSFQVAALERRFRLIIPDLPGSGHSLPPRGEYSIPGCAQSLWCLLDHLKIRRTSIIGYSLGGAVGLEMALHRPEQVRRLALINSLAAYRVDHWRSWLELRGTAALVRVLGMRRSAWLLAARMFPEPWQRALRRRAVAVIGAGCTQSILRMAQALLRWTALDRLDRIRARALVIAGERDYLSMAEKRALAAKLRAAVVFVRGSRHGTPFDSVHATNASLLALLSDRALPACGWLDCDQPIQLPELILAGSIAEEHAMEPQISVSLARSTPATELER
jgi:3-oxoadipate enol-lactonase